MTPEQAMQMARRIIAAGRKATGDEFCAFIAAVRNAYPMEFASWAGRPVRRWPAEEFLMRNPCTPTVRDRVLRLNPTGQREGELPRGWHPQRLAKRRALRGPDFARDMVEVRHRGPRRSVA